MTLELQDYSPGAEFYDLVARRHTGAMAGVLAEALAPAGTPAGGPGAGPPSERGGPSARTRRPARL